MSKEGGSFKGGGTMTAVRSGPSIGKSFGSERTGPLSFKIGPTKSSPSAGLRLGGFNPLSPVFKEGRATGYDHSKTRAFHPDKTPAISSKAAVTSKYRSFERSTSLRKPTTQEKAGMRPYREGKNVSEYASLLGGKMNSRLGESQSLRVNPKADGFANRWNDRREKVTYSKSADTLKVLPKSLNVKRTALQFDRSDPKLGIFSKTHLKESRALEQKAFQWTEPQKPTARKDVTTPKVERDQALKWKVAKAYIKAGIVHTPQEAQKRVEQVLDKRLEWIPLKQRTETVLPKTKKESSRQITKTLEKPVSREEEVRKAQLVREIRQIAQGSPTIAMNEPLVMQQLNTVALAHGKTEKQVVAASAALLKKDEEKEKDFYVEDTKASVIRINLSLFAAVRLFAFGEEPKKKITGEDVVRLIPTHAPSEGISQLVRDRKSTYDGSYIAWRDKLAVLGETRSVGEVVDAAKAANASAPPVEVSKDPKAKRVTIKDVLRVLLGIENEEDEN